MIGVIERVKNSVLLKCSTLNDELIAKTLLQLIDAGVYHFAEEMMSIIGDFNVGISEQKLRNDVDELISTPLVKKIKRKLFIDSLALQITNDSFIESYVNDEISMDKLSKTYIKELRKNKNSNQLNMTEDLRMDEIMERVRLYVEKNIILLVNENEFLVTAINDLVGKTKEEFEQDLEKMIDEADLKYQSILIDELNEEVKHEEKGEINMMESINNVPDVEEPGVVLEDESSNNKFAKYDDMTLFNKVILSLNTREEKLSRSEDKLEKRKVDIDERLSVTNKNIEANIERENQLSQRKMELNSREVELNSRLSEAEVIFLNMKPLIKGLSKISVSAEEGGNESE